MIVLAYVGLIAGFVMARYVGIKVLLAGLGLNILEFVVLMVYKFTVSYTAYEVWRMAYDISYLGWGMVGGYLMRVIAKV